MSVVDLNTVKELTLAEGITARMVHADKLSVAHVRLLPGAVAPMHVHPHEQVTSVITGELALTVNGETVTLAPGQAVVLPPSVPHSAKAVTTCYVIDVFHPVREDLRARMSG
ncbi:MAG: cupin domain-containing protein [candidate division Zixibacteria bacterium]|nr:cupin domain-containing protein [candidate division Zixibacteria bacterium]